MFSSGREWSKVARITPETRSKVGCFQQQDKISIGETENTVAHTCGCVHHSDMQQPGERPLLLLPAINLGLINLCWPQFWLHDVRWVLRDLCQAVCRASLLLPSSSRWNNSISWAQYSCLMLDRQQSSWCMRLQVLVETPAGGKPAPVQQSSSNNRHGHAI